MKSFLQNEIVNFPHLMLMANLSPITMIKLISFLLTIPVAFSSSLKHAQFIAFMRNLMLILFWMYWLQFLQQEFIWLRLKLTFNCFSLWTNYYFVIESIHIFYFINNIVYEVLLVQVKGGKLVYKIFTVAVLSMHLSATCQLWLFRSS